MIYTSLCSGGLVQGHNEADRWFSSPPTDQGTHSQVKDILNVESLYLWLVTTLLSDNIISVHLWWMNESYVLCRLTISGLVPTDWDTYHCVATNTLGDSSASITLTGWKIKPFESYFLVLSNILVDFFGSTTTVTGEWSWRQDVSIVISVVEREW